MAKQRVTALKVFSKANELGFQCVVVENGQGNGFKILDGTTQVATAGNSKEAMQFLAGYEFALEANGEAQEESAA